ncbi:MAG: DUF1998 domain-containing protein, partial [Proteobacteria bacterium]|nr:DUF1998 domain-containing protein [Pseudomonadota bacterium]
MLDDYPEWKDKIAAYRAGYLPEERREIEKGLFEGRLKGVIATSALELGIDIGGLEVGVLVGYPGTIATTWQRSGRVGRQILAPDAEGVAGGSESLVVMVATADALDQFFMNDPEEFFRRRPEAAIADPDNPVVVKNHLVCAAAELPLEAAGDSMNPESHREIVLELEKEGGLLRDAEGSRWFSSRRYPQRKIGLRSAGDEFAIRSVTGEVVGMIDEVRVKSECHPGAIYLHRGKQYRGEDIDWGKKEVLVRPVEVDYYTVPKKEEEVEILKEEADRSGGRVHFGRVRVTERVTGYEQKRFSGEKSAEFPLDLPESVFETEALWFGIHAEARDGIERGKRDFSGALHAVEHALIAIFPLFALCDRNDLGGVSYPYNLQVRGPAIFVYDGHPGGVGLCRKGFREFPELVRATRDLIRRCPCPAGCPTCNQSPKCGSGNRPLDKPGALILVEYLYQMESSLNSPLPRGEPARAGQNRPGGMEGRVDIITPPLPQSSPLRAGGSTEPEALKGEENASAPIPGKILFFDLETQKSAAEVGGWEKADAMRMSIAVVWDSLANAYLRFRESGMEELARALKGADLVVGFNTEGFDYQVLSAYPEFTDVEIKTLDILLELKKTVGMRISLKNLSSSTLGKGKLGDGLQALDWFRAGDFDRLFEYCEKDVELTRELFEFGLKYGYLLLEKGGQLVRVPV